VQRGDHPGYITFERYLADQLAGHISTVGSIVALSALHGITTANGDRRRFHRRSTL
jgi:hypothetical protein